MRALELIAVVALTTYQVACTTDATRPAKPASASTSVSTPSDTSSPSAGDAPARSGPIAPAAAPLGAPPAMATAIATATATATATGDAESYNGAWPPPEDASCSTPSPSARETARYHFRDGVEAYERADFRRAILEFEQAYRLACNGHTILYNVAKAQDAVGAYADAIASYELCLQRDHPPADQVAEIATRLSELRKKVASTPP